LKKREGEAHQQKRKGETSAQPNTRTALNPSPRRQTDPVLGGRGAPLLPPPEQCFSEAKNHRCLMKEVGEFGNRTTPPLHCARNCHMRQ